MMGRGWDYGWDMMGIGGGWISMLLTALFFAMIVAGLVVMAVWAIRAATGHGGHRATMAGGHGGGHRDEARSGDSVLDLTGPRSGRADEAMDIARRRYASGEITREQYEEILSRLRG